MVPAPEVPTRPLIVLDAILLLLAALLAVPALVLAVEVAASASAARRLRRDPPPDQGARPNVAVIVPAHDERAVLPRTLTALLDQLDLDGGDRLVVVADNCSDDTAAVARVAGAEVVERRDVTHRGKGHALDAGLRHFEKGGGRPPVVVFNDADVIAAPGAIAALARQVERTGRPAQGDYLMDLPGGERSRPEDLVSRFAFVLKNRVRPLGLWQLGLPCPLTGSGMAMPFDVAAKAPLATSDLVEDMRLGVRLCRDGHPPLFCPRAHFVGELPGDPGDAARQRRRWEHGHLSVLAATPGLLLRGCGRLDGALCAAALDHAVQPLTVLAGGLVVTTLAAAVAWAVGGGPLAVAAMATAGAAFAVLIAALFVAWRIHLRREIPAAAVRGLPRYIVARVPNQLGWLLRRQRAWVRTPRREERVEPPAPGHNGQAVVEHESEEPRDLVAAGERE